MHFFADVSSCLRGSNTQDSAGSLETSGKAHSSLWSGLTAAACLNATQQLDDPSYNDKHTAASMPQSAVLNCDSRDDVLAESRLRPDSGSGAILSGSDFDQSERRHGVYTLPVQLLRHMQTLQQKIDADTWQMVWCLYATEDVLPGALQHGQTMQLRLFSSGHLCVCP